MKHEITFGRTLIRKAAEARAQAALKMAITVHNAAIEDAAKVAENASVDEGDWAQGIIATAIRKLKRAL